MRRRVVIQFQGDEVSYHMAITIICAQLKRGQTRGDGVLGLAAWSYQVETEHPPEQKGVDTDPQET